MSGRSFLLCKVAPLVAALTSLRVIDRCSENQVLSSSHGGPYKSSLPFRPGHQGVITDTFCGHADLYVAPLEKAGHSFLHSWLCLCLGVRSCPGAIGSTSWILRSLSPHLVCCC